MLRYPFFRICVSVIMLWLWQANGSPDQYYAQVYTEILGRSPSPSEWVANEYRFTADSISVQNTRSVIVSLLQSSEFTRLGYTAPEKAFVLYRGILLREPGNTELTSLANQLNAGTSITSIAESMMNSSEFSHLISNQIKSLRAHGFQNSGPSERSQIGDGGLGNTTGSQLQAALDAALPGQTVFLSRGALVRTHQTIRIPQGVTLSTYDSGAADHLYRNRQAYAAMGRIVRSSMFAKPLVEVMPGGRLIGVWVDGRRSQLRVNDPTLRNQALTRDERFFDSHNLRVLGSTSPDAVTEVSFCKISDSTGWTSLHSVGSDGGFAVGYSKIANNMITSYSSCRDLSESFFTDGISNASSDAVIINNDIVDPSDVGIVLFNPGMLTGQRSQVVANDVLFAGIEGWGGITMDHSVKINDFCVGVNSAAPYNCFDVGNPAIVADFNGTLIQNNQIWSSDSKYVNVGISLGVHFWGLRMFGQGGQVLANTLGTTQQPLNTGVGMVIAGIREPVVLENALNLALNQNYVSCFSTRMLFDPLSTALGGPNSIVQEGFTSGEAWGMLRAKSNGYIFGEFKLQPASDADKGVVLDEATLKVLDLSGNLATDNWTILHSERNFGDSQQYYLVQNRGTHQVIDSGDSEGVSVSPFTGAETQYWRFEGFEGQAPGKGLRMVNKVTGEYLGRDATGQVFTATQSAQDSFSWKFQRLEKRKLDFAQPELMFVNPLGEVFQVYLETAKIFEDRSIGNPGLSLAVNLYSDDSSECKPLGQLDFNNDGRMDTAYIKPDGSFFINFLTPSGYNEGGNIGNMRAVDGFRWDISNAPNSWEKPVGFMDLGNTSTEDLIVIDAEGFLEVGYVTEGGLGNSAKLGSAASIGLSGATSSTTSPIKSLGSGDFDGDGKRELLFVGAAGGLFTVKGSNGKLDGAVGVGNPIEKFGFGVTSDASSQFKPVSITDVTGDGVDDIVMVEGTGTLLAIVMKNGIPSSVVNLGSPRLSWSWNIGSDTFYSRPLAIPYGKGWWNW